MIIDENSFYREASRRICNHLDIETAMRECMRYIQTFIPSDVMFLQLFEFELGSMRTIAKATVEEGEQLDLITALPEPVREALEKGVFPDCVIINYPESTMAGRVMLDYHGIKDASLLMLMLKADKNTLGHLILVADNKKTFSEGHQIIFELLKEPFTIALSNALKHRELNRLKDLLADDNQFLCQELIQTSGSEVVGSNFGLRKVMEIARQVALHDSPILLLGETGTGKDVIANMIHRLSPRSSGPMITVNCGAIPDSLIDSELFGHEKGAFTGALSLNRGRFERANNGTIFLDEIGELPAAAQVRLLRVLQNEEIERVGGTSTIKVNTRVIAATHRDLERMVAEGEFREDLWFRLNVIPMSIPPLRERKADIPALTQHFIERKTKELKLRFIPKLASEAIDHLTAYDWPGNVRELQNVIERALILTQNETLNFGHLTPGRARPIAIEEEKYSTAPPATLDTVICNHIKSVLKFTGGKVHGPEGAAEILGLNTSTLRGKMNKLGIPYGRSDKQSQ